MNLKVSFDLLTLEVFYEEIKDIIINSIIEKIYQIGSTDIFWEIYSPHNGRYNLILSVHPQLYRIQLTRKNFPYPSKPPSFSMLLRKHLEGGRIIEYQLIPQERIIEFKIKTFPEESKKVILELMGKYSNLILVNENNIIIDAIKHVPSEINRFREVIPGVSYIYPPKSIKIPISELTEEKLENLLNKDIPIRDLILKEISHMNPHLVNEIIEGIGNKIANTLTLTEKNILKERLLNIKEKILKREFKPTAYLINGEPITFSLFPLKDYEDFEKKEFDKVYKLVDYIYSYAFENALFTQKKNRLLEIIKTNMEKVEEKIKELDSQIKEGEEAETFRIKGETLILNQNSIRKGLEKVTFLNPYNPNEYIEIELDPSLSAIENAQKYFKKYKKLKRGISILKEYKSKLEEELFYLNSLEFSIENANSLSELMEIEEELEKEGYIKEKKEKIQKKVEKSEPYKFISSDGFEIYVGKNNKQNDYITFNLAKPEDIWLHTRGIPGAHVIIKTQDKEVPESTLYEAGALAGYFSKGRNSTYVPVDYTLRKYVQKPKGAKPGFVIYKNEKTIFAKPEEALRFLSQETKDSFKIRG